MNQTKNTFIYRIIQVASKIVLPQVVINAHTHTHTHKLEQKRCQKEILTCETIKNVFVKL